MKTVLWCLAVIGGLVLAGAVAAPFVIDEEARKNAIAAELEEHLNAGVTIAGDVSFSLLPQPSLELADVRIDPTRGGPERHPSMNIPRARLDLSLTALISGEPGLERASLNQPRLVLVAPEPGKVGQDLADTDIWLKRLEGLAPLQLEIANGQILLAESEGEARILADQLDMTTRVPEGGTPLRFVGEGRWRDHSHRISLAVGAASTGQQRAFDLTWSSADLGEAEGRLRGDITFADNETHLSAQMALQGENLEAILGDTAQDGRPPLPFNLESRVESDFGELALTEASLRLVGVDATGQAKIRFSRIPALDLQLDIQHIEFPTWQERLQGHGRKLLAGILARNIDGRVRIKLDSLRMMDDLVQDLRLDATLAPGSALVERLQATAPGGTRLQLSGTLTPAQQGLGFDGNVQGETGNLRRFLSWLNLETDSVPGERLRHADLTSGFQYSNDLLQLTGLELDLDVSSFTGGVAIALRDRLGLGLGLEVDRLDLDGYLSRNDTADREGSDSGGTLEELSAFGKLLTRFDANLDLKAQRLTYLGQRVSDLQLTGRLQGGELAFDRLEIGNLDSLETTLSGRIDNLDSTPQITGTQFDLSLQDPGRLADRMDLPFTSYFQRLGPVRASGILDGPLNALTVNSDMDLARASLFLAGLVTNDETGMAVSNGKLDLEGLSGPQLGDWLDLAEDNALRRLPELHATSDFSLSQGTWNYETRLESAEAQLDLKGTTKDLDIGYPVTDFRFDFRHPQEAGVLPSLLDQPNRNVPALLASGQAKASPRAIELPEGRVTLAEDSLDLAGEWIFSGRRPEMNLEVHGPRLSLDNLGAFLPVRNDDASAYDSPLPLSFLRTFQGRLDLSLDQLDTAWKPLEDLDASMALENDQLQVETLEGRVLGGTFSANGNLTADAIGSYQASLDGSLNDMPMGYFARSLLGSFPARGSFDLPLSLSTEGESFSRMIRNLSGEMNLSGRLPQNVRSYDETESETDAKASELERLFNLLELPASVDGRIQIGSGRLTSDNLEFRGPARRLELKGMLADLPRHRIQVLAELYEEAEETPASVLEITGPLGTPEQNWERFGQNLSGNTTQGELAPAAQ
ncbi:MAG: AsmA family protein [Pseudomonadota bacterium]